jgi:catechol 2,3-dioxygenase-like lactoylglutathione lyase family enzyme
MIKTYGLTHIALTVKDPQRSSEFYQKVFGAKEMYRTDDFIQIQTPDRRDIIVFEKAETHRENTSGILHFGFRMVNADDMDEAVKAVEEAGGKIKERGEFVPGEPYVFFYDPDGYEVEIWFEKLPSSLSGFQ